MSLLTSRCDREQALAVSIHCPDPLSVQLAYVGLGSNLGESEQILTAAVEVLAQLAQTQLLRCSSLYGSAPVDASGPDFINAVALLQTTLKPLELLAALQAIEARFGRQRPYPNAPRTLDLDLLCHGQTLMQTHHLNLPHPRLHERAFVLLPLAELDAAFVIPGHGAVQAHLEAVSDQQIKKLSAWVSGDGWAPRTCTKRSQLR